MLRKYVLLIAASLPFAYGQWGWPTLSPPYNQPPSEKQWTVNYYYNLTDTQNQIAAVRGSLTKILKYCLNLPTSQADTILICAIMGVLIEEEVDKYVTKVKRFSERASEIRNCDKRRNRPNGDLVSHLNWDPYDVSGHLTSLNRTITYQLDKEMPNNAVGDIYLLLVMSAMEKAEMINETLFVTQQAFAACERNEIYTFPIHTVHNELVEHLIKRQQELNYRNFYEIDEETIENTPPTVDNIQMDSSKQQITMTIRIPLKLQQKTLNRKTNEIDQLENELK